MEGRANRGGQDSQPKEEIGHPLRFERLHEIPVPQTAARHFPHIKCSQCEPFDGFTPVLANSVMPLLISSEID
jgi:hypothetical protein